MNTWLCAEHGIGADIELIDAADVNEAYDRAVAGTVRYRAVIDVATIPEDGPLLCAHPVVRRSAPCDTPVRWVRLSKPRRLAVVVSTGATSGPEHAQSHPAG